MPGRMVFLSCVGADSDLASDVAESLRDNGGFECWIPSFPRTGRDAAALERCQALLPILSSASAHSAAVEQEVEFAVGHNIRIVPYRISDVVLSEALAYFVDTLAPVDALQMPPERQMDALRTALEEGGQESPPVLPVTAVAIEPFISLRGLLPPIYWLSALLGIAAALSLIGDLRLMAGGRQAFPAGKDAAAVGGAVQTMFWMALSIPLLIFIYRSYRNLILISSHTQRYSPGGVVWRCMVPHANMVWSFMIFSEIWRVSLGPSAALRRNWAAILWLFGLAWTIALDVAFLASLAAHPPWGVLIASAVARDITCLLGAIGIWRFVSAIAEAQGGHRPDPQPLVQPLVQPPAEARRRNVLLAFAPQNRPAAERLAMILDAHSSLCWIRADTGGESLEGLPPAIDVLLPVLSRHSAAAPYIETELRRAEISGTALLPVVLDAQELPAALGVHVRSVQWIDASKQGLETASERLGSALPAFSRKDSPERDQQDLAGAGFERLAGKPQLNLPSMAANGWRRSMAALVWAGVAYVLLLSLLAVRPALVAEGKTPVNSYAILTSAVALWVFIWILFVLWLSAAYRNAVLLDPGQAKHTRARTLVRLFIPGLNLLWMRRILKAVLQSGDDSDADRWNESTRGLLLRSWWLLTLISACAAIGLVAPGSAPARLWLEPAAIAVLAAQWLIAAKLMAQVSRAQQRRRSSLLMT